MRLSIPAFLCFALAAPQAPAFVHARSGNQALRRRDSTNIQYLINDKTAPGLTNADGIPIITADSDPIAALQAAMDTWTAVDSATINFAPPGRSPVANSTPDGDNIFIFADNPINRSVLGSAVALTMLFSSNGVLSDTDILFSPTLTFSTTLESGTYDLQSVATHELGHALGADHSGLTGATMFFAVRRGSNILSALSTDDIAFATETYPKPGAPASLGTISGTVRLTGGGPVVGALLTAIDPSTGVAIGAISATDGTYAITMLPPGRYLVYAEPMDGPVSSNQFFLRITPNLSFTTTFFGGNDNPQTVTLSAGGAAVTDIDVPGGAPALNIQGGGSAPAGQSIALFGGAVGLRAGQTVDFAVFGAGLDDPTISESTISFLGAPLTIQKGSLRRGRTAPSNLPLIAFTVQVATSAPPGLATLLVRSSNSAAVYSGGAKLLGPAPILAAAGVVNAASFLGGAVAPGEIVAIFGSNMGPATGVAGGLDAAGRLASSLGAVAVTFNGVRAPLFFVRNNQINAQVPYEVAQQSNADVVVTYQGASSAPVSVPVAAARLGIFVQPGSSQGIVLNQDGTLNASATPAARGSFIVVYATGPGAIRPALGTGELAPLAGPLSNVVQQVTATIGGRPATVLFAGMAPSFAGLMQVNIQVPSDAPQGSGAALVLNVGGVTSQPNVTVAVR